MPLCFSTPLALSRTPCPPKTASFRPLSRPARRPRARAGIRAQSTLVLTEENVNAVLGEAKEELGAVFGNSEENLGVGITGDVALATLDGPMVTLKLSGRFWHKRADVVARVESFLMNRIPEICDVSIEDEEMLDDSEAAAAAS
eukprot:Plantae.Rhodophyta-Palmaria_palmata.ctg3241.p2 GENE.Plantae.Rhodophyta-Palmaria_palmata.ctg3241~~Plantae.Rhodophyta-Palmaria_palmata.ctg3241.p2  ORF type:complete len:144 (-),score=23.90 Plantae.Rhodophyta-Palmaria_palmata.ctg3241:399-830(-)